MNWQKFAKAVDAARVIKVAFFDADGVIFPACTMAGGESKGKQWSYNDGLGLSLLRGIGISVVFLTSEKGEGAEPIKYLVERWNNLPSATKEGGWSKIILYTELTGEGKTDAAIDFLKTTEGFTVNECSYMGDDLIDVSLLQKVLLPVAPAQAEQVVKDIALFTTVRNGGEGAVRDFADFVLAVRGMDSTMLAFS